MARTIKRYSEAFKMKVVQELESGKLRGIAHAREVYAIGGCSTIPRWISQYGKNHLLNKVVVVKMADEKDQIKQLKDKIRMLEEALADTKCDQLIERAYFEVLCEKTGTDPEEIKKKAEQKWGIKRSR